MVQLRTIDAFGCEYDTHARYDIELPRIPVMRSSRECSGNWPQSIRGQNSLALTGPIYPRPSRFLTGAKALGKLPTSSMVNQRA